MFVLGMCNHLVRCTSFGVAHNLTVMMITLKKLTEFLFICEGQRVSRVQRSKISI